MGLRGILFDVHGTLLRLREPVGATYARLALPYGVELPASRIEEAFGRILASAPPMCFPGEPAERVRALERAWWRDVVRGTFAAADGTARFQDFEAYFDAVFTHYAEPATWEPMPGAADCLARLRSPGRRLGVASNFDHRLTGILEASGFADLFESVTTPAELGSAKPDPAFFAGAAERLGVPPAACAYVGDDDARCLAAARTAGLAAFGLDGAATLATIPDRIAALEQEIGA